MSEFDPRSHRNRYAGRDIYVLGSGPSLNHIPTRFFDGKLVVGTNHGVMTYLGRADYLVSKYHHHARDYRLRWPDIPVVVTRGNLGSISSTGMLEDGPPFIVVDHNRNPGDTWRPTDWPTDPDALIATWSTIATAMHWAAYLGAANIIMAGHDCGWIDDVGRVPGYRQAADNVADDDGDSPMWEGFDAQSRMVKHELMERYGCTVTSVNPWINLALEGHTYRFAGG